MFDWFRKKKTERPAKQHSGSTENGTWYNNHGQPFRQEYPLELYVPKKVLLALVAEHVRTVKMKRLPDILEAATEKADCEQLLEECAQLSTWLHNHPEEQVFVQLSPQSEFEVTHHHKPRDQGEFGRWVPPSGPPIC